jgi:putative CocE/NonD family hydrolase
MERTPYSAGPYGAGNYPRSLGPNEGLMKEKYIFVYQDVRGRYMSEGVNLEVTPYIANKKSKTDVDESSDTYDTVDWLLKNIKNNNGRVGLAGISYPGFYATACLPGAHPAIKAVSPQAPVTDEFIGDDANHNGAFFLLDNFSFMNFFDRERNGPVKNYAKPFFSTGSKDAYQFYLKMATIKNTNSAKYYNHKSVIWNEYLQHDTYDAYWKARNIRPHLKNINIPVLLVGGWFDAEDLFGALRTYEGPWTHGAWSGNEWTKFATHEFGSNTSKFFQDSLETQFFNYYLKDKGNFNAAEATVFETGSNQWKNYDVWPPKNSTAVNYYFNNDHKLSLQKATGVNNFDEYLSDPNKPVPYTNGTFGGRNNEYMAEDQRFAALRPDVVVFETEELTEDITLAGRINADLFVSTTGTDADFL